MTSLPADLEARFVELEVRLEELIGLLEAADETFWLRFMTRALHEVRERRLAGATYVLGCYGGEATFSDVTLGRADLDRRLVHLRTSIFEVANHIASRSAGG